MNNKKYLINKNYAKNSIYTSYSYKHNNIYKF